MASRLLIITSPSQTGDTPHVAGALALRDDIDVLVLFKEGEVTGDVTAFYQHVAGKAAGNDGTARAKLWGAAKARHHAIRTELTPEDQHPKALTPEGVDLLKEIGFDSSITYFTLSVVGATKVVADEYHKGEVAARAKVVGAFCSDLDPDAIKPIMPEALITLSNQPDKRVVLLWARYTGQNKPDAYNPAGDSDPTGQRQIMDEALALGFQVITIGHDPDPKRKEEGVHADPYHLGEFYLNKTIDLKGRARQASYLVTLMKLFQNRIVQIGQKTGGMDTAALLGIPTIYIEHEGSLTKDRMIMWEKNMLYYKCALVKQPPTFLGKAIPRLDERCRELAPLLKDHSKDQLKNFVDKNGLVQPPDISDIQSLRLSAIDRNISSFLLLDTVSSGNSTYEGLQKELEGFKLQASGPNTKKDIRISDWPSINPSNKDNPPPPLNDQDTSKALSLAVWIKFSGKWDVEAGREVIGKLIRDNSKILEGHGLKGYDEGDLAIIRDELKKAKLALQ